MRFQQHAAVVLDRRPPTQAGHAVQSSPRLASLASPEGSAGHLGAARRWPARRQAVHAHDEDALCRRPRVAKSQVERRVAQRAPELAAVQHVAADRIRPAEQCGHARHVALGQRRAHGRARHAQAMHLVALHARHVEALRLARTVEQGIVARAPGAETEVVAHQHVAGTQTAHQHLLNEGLRRQRGERFVEAQHHDLRHAAALELGQLVAQRRDAWRRQLGLAGSLGEEVARMRLERQHARRQAAVPRLVGQQREHGLVAAVHAVEAADRQRAGACDLGMVKAAEDAHGARLSRRATAPRLSGAATASCRCRSCCGGARGPR